MVPLYLKENRGNSVVVLQQTRPPQCHHAFDPDQLSNKPTSHSTISGFTFDTDDTIRSVGELSNTQLIF